jgi:8-oxo-dGTP diphosphatase
LHEELGIGVKVGAKCAESLHQYDHGNFRVVAYVVEWLTGEPRPSVHDRLEWVRLEDIERYQLLPADVPIAASLQKLKELSQ